MAENLIPHLETHLGPILEGWTKDRNGEQAPVQVVGFRSKVPPATVYSTLGLSDHRLTCPRSGKAIRMELIALVPPEAANDLGMPALLQQVARLALSDHRAYLRGEVIGPYGSICPGSPVEALYVSAPAYFADSFAVCETAGLGSVVIAWLIPISAHEAKFVRDVGWEQFEDLLVEQDPDLADPFRPPLVLPERSRDDV